MKIIPILILLLIPGCLGWSSLNIEDFIGEVNCTANITEILAEENMTEPSFDKVLEYEQDPTCENYLRGSFHWFELTYPENTCPQRFNTAIHEWFDLWNWQFNDCGISFGKSDLDILIQQYEYGFYLGELEYEEETRPIIEYNYNYTEPNTTQTIGGGADVHYIWQTWAFIPNWAWLEIAILLISLWFGSLFWSRDSYRRSDLYFSGSPERNVMWSGMKKLWILLTIFTVLNILAWYVIYFYLL